MCRPVSSSIIVKLFCFVLIKAVLSQNGLLTTVAYKLGPDQPTVYALEVSAVMVICSCQNNAKLQTLQKNW